MAVPEIDEPVLWKPDQSGNTRLKRELDACEEENKSLNSLIAHLGVAVITSRQKPEVGRKAFALNCAFPVQGSYWGR